MKILRDPSRWTGFTDANGDVTITFTHNAPSQSWYLWGRFQKLSVSDVITVGT